jgi:hypothetical protein
VLFISGLGIAIAAAYCADGLLLQNESDNLTEKRTMNITSFTVLVFVLTFCGVLAVTAHKISFGLAWSCGAVIVLGIWTVLIGARKISGKVWLYGVLCFTCAELTLLDFKTIQPQAKLPSPLASVQAARYLAEQPGLFRVYSPSYSLPQNLAAQYGLQLADGVDPMQLKSYAAYFSTASGIRETGYSVTLPPFAGGNPGTDNANAVPDAGQLGKLNVKYVVSAFDVDSANLNLKARFGETRIYENMEWLPRAWMQTTAGNVADGVTITKWEPNRIEVTANGAGRLVLSEIAYPGWTVKIDSNPARLVIAEDILRAVDLPVGGQHQVDFEFEPDAFYAGAAISAASWIALLAGLVFRKLERK